MISRSQAVELDRQQTKPERRQKRKQLKKKQFRKRLNVVIAMLLTAQVIAMCCVSVVYATESKGHVTARPSGIQTYSFMNSGNYTGWLYNKINTVSHNRVRWLYELMTAAGFDVDADKSNGVKVLEQARRYGIINVYSEDDIYLPITRRFVGYTMVKAFDYPYLNAGYIADISDAEGYMSTMAYFGYFLPDINDNIHPDSAVTNEEYDRLMTELDRYRRLKGKSVLSFGDSIMYGTGNGGEGISDMIAIKYGMSCTDYAVPGATFGESSGRGHIPDQIRKAYSQGRTADIILINGGTNDMNHTAFGNITDGYDMSKTSEKPYTEAFERSLWMLGTYWRYVPVIYIRAHNMELGEDANERRYGERAMEIAEKWSINAIDLYNDSGMNTEDKAICSRYSYLNPSTGMTCDSIHPNAIGYAKFYLSPVAQTMDEIFSGEAQ